MSLKNPAKKVSDAASRPRLTSREILQIKALLEREKQAENAVPSIAHLAGTYDSEFMEQLRQLIRENREETARMLAKDAEDEE